MITVKLIDREAVVHLVDGLEDFEKDRAIRVGLRLAANVFKIRGRSNLRQRIMHPEKSSGRLMRSFTNKVKRNKLGALSGFKRSNKYKIIEDAGNHAHLVDKGTKRRYTKKGQDRGIMPANNFWSDAEVSEQSKATQMIYIGVERAVKRINDRQR